MILRSTANSFLDTSVESKKSAKKNREEDHRAKEQDLGVCRSTGAHS